MLDERFFMFMEEMEWCYRIKKAGWKIYYLSDVQNIHYAGRSVVQNPAEMAVQVARSRLIFFKTHYGRLQTFVLVVSTFILGLAKTLLGWIGQRLSNGKGDSFSKHFHIGRGMLSACAELPRIGSPQISTRRAADQRPL